MLDWPQEDKGGSRQRCLQKIASKTGAPGVVSLDGDDGFGLFDAQEPGWRLGRRRDSVAAESGTMQ